ncbi:hypothetical protein [Bradyrhizobium sp. sGM-13]|uniref:hypothetical protein n=1 Tax=Bradyrhizobium sp. sGM-13 TaxID=2831781 RepID=UPI001BCEE48E|nr:hypothetical protein [Bradyrhizobium sp. sGM-13]
MTEEIFLNDDQYTRLVERLANLEPCPFAGKITPDQIKIALGEAGDIWPAEIYGDVVAAWLEECEKLRAME